MHIEFTSNKKVKISMPDHIDKATKMFGEDLSIEVSSPATHKLHTINPKQTNLSPQKMPHMLFTLT